MIIIINLYKAITFTFSLKKKLVYYYSSSNHGLQLHAKKNVEHKLVLNCSMWKNITTTTTYQI